MSELVFNEHKILLRAIFASHDVTNEDTFKIFINNFLKSLLPHSQLSCYIGYATNERTTFTLIPNGLLTSDIVGPEIPMPILAHWLQSGGKPLFINTSSTTPYAPSYNTYYSESGIESLLIHGFVSHHGGGTIFAFTNLPSPLDAKRQKYIEILMPHMCVSAIAAYCARTKKDTQPANLSPRQLEVLMWIAKGKTSRDIGQIMNISEKTVNAHTATVLERLHASNRAHAVACAIDLGILIL